MLKLADLAPTDFYRNVMAAEVIVRRDGDTSLAAPYIARARQLLTPAVAEKHDWAAAWLELLPAFERWVAADISGVAHTLRTLSGSLAGRGRFERDALATGHGYLWLALGRLDDARKAFEMVGHVSQRELNLALMADLLDDRRQMVERLTRFGCSSQELLVLEDTVRTHALHDSWHSYRLVDQGAGPSRESLS